jgi:hypothetical protein
VVVLVASLSAAAFCEEPEKVSACQLQSDPAAFNHKLVQVTSFLSHGFEDFTLLDPMCMSWPDIWVEYGGKSASGTVYCCGGAGERTRLKQLRIENVAVPLTQDANFRKLDALLQAPRGYAIAHAAFVGRFFAGREMSSPRGKYCGGYGHMGCCSLLVIQQVLAVDKHDRDDLSYESYVDQPDLEKLKCGSYRDLTAILPYGDMLKAQKEAESGKGSYAFDDPKRVAISGLANLLKIDGATITGLKESRGAQGKIIYEWHPTGETQYMVVITRPYWLSFYAQDPGRVAWVLAAAYEECTG